MSKSIDLLALEYSERIVPVVELKNDRIITTREAIRKDVYYSFKDGYKQRSDELIDLLVELEDYFDNRADADGSSEGYTPNKEMQFLVAIRLILDK
jgi:hypothetical protein